MHNGAPLSALSNPNLPPNVKSCIRLPEWLRGRQAKTPLCTLYTDQCIPSPQCIHSPRLLIPFFVGESVIPFFVGEKHLNGFLTTPLKDTGGHIWKLFLLFLLILTLLSMSHILMKQVRTGMHYTWRFLSISTKFYALSITFICQCLY
jgi:hypothetical protein